MPTHILALEASGDFCSVALCCKDKTYQIMAAAPRRLSRELLPQISRMLATIEMRLAEITCIAFGAGPGSFTGVRLVSSLIQGVAFGLSVPVMPISTLQAMAQEAYDLTAAKAVAVAMPAYGGKIYWGLYKTSKAQIASPIRPDALQDPHSITLPQTQQITGVGHAWQQAGLLHLHKSLHQVIPVLYPKARYIAALARVSFDGTRCFDPKDAMPFVYDHTYWNKTEAQVKDKVLHKA